MSVGVQRGRIARVRRIQHGLAASIAAKAAGHVHMLETNDQKLAQMREALVAGEGRTTGAALAGLGELAGRIESARHGLGATIAGARDLAEQRERARLGARLDQESAEKLERRAAQAAGQDADRRMAARFRPRPRNRGEKD